MNKKLLAVAVVGALASPLAFAQSTTIYGGIDVGYQNASNYTSGSSNHNFIQSGQDYTSRIGFKGSDDVAPGMTAIYVMEAGINADVGTQDSAGFWQRQLYGGLDSKQWGALTLGRQYTVMHNNYGIGTWSVLTAAGTLAPSGHVVRASNAVKYTSPKFGGFGIAALWSPQAADTENTTATIDNGKMWEAGVLWAQGPFGAAFAHSNVKTDTGVATGEAKRNQITGKWDNGAFGIFAGYAKDTRDGAAATATTGTDTKHYWIQPLVRFAGSNEAFGLWGRAKVEGIAGSEPKTTWWGVGARHYMTKRSWLYGVFGTAKNDGGARGVPTTFAAAIPAGQDQDPRAIQLGVATTF